MKRTRASARSAGARSEKGLPQASQKFSRHGLHRSFLEELEAEAATRRTLSGATKVKVKYKTVPEAEKKTRNQAIAETILKALRRMKVKK